MKTINVKDKELYKSSILSDFLPIEGGPVLNFQTFSLDYNLKPKQKDEKYDSLDMIVNPNLHTITPRPAVKFTGIDNETRQNLDKMFHIDLDAEVRSTLIRETQQLMIRDYLNKVDRLASKLPPLYVGFVQKSIAWVYSLFNEIYRPVLGLKNAKDFTYVLLLYSNVIMKSARRGPGNFAVMSSKLAAMLQTDEYYTPSKIRYITNPSFYHVGNIAGLKIYADASLPLDDNKVIIGRTNVESSSDPGLFLGYKKYATKIKETKGSSSKLKSTSDFVLNPKYAIVEHGKRPELQFRKILVTIKNY